MNTTTIYKERFMSNNTKTKSKRMGVKSVLVHGDSRLAITTFGRGNQADIAMDTDAQGKDLSLPCSAGPLTIQRIDKDIALERGILETILDNPAEEVSDDYLGLKETLEKEFFGQKFSKDNIRIQIIYNILDIFKILGIYICDIVYTINNLQADPTDVVGLSLSEEKKKETLKKMTPYFGFFGDAFKIFPKKKEDKKKDKKKDNIKDAKDEKLFEEINKHNYDVLRNLSMLRQITAHWGKPIFENGVYFQKSLKANQGNWDIIANLYKKRIDEINRDFLNKSKTNLSIIFRILGVKNDEKKKDIVQDYYRFAILKMGKNLGANMTKIREILIKESYSFLKDKKYNSYRSKLYTITDYLLYQHFCGSQQLDKLVAELRLTSDEEEKENLYQTFVRNIKNQVKSKLDLLLAPLEFNTTYATLVGKDKVEDIPQVWMNEVALSSSNGIPFVQILSFLCNFMEGKEINELLTAYIHKFENIQAFIDILENLGEKVIFAKHYGAFNEFESHFAGKVAQQLRNLVSIGKMKPDLEGAKRILYEAAIKTLGVSDKQYVTNDWLDENILISPQASDYKQRKTQINPFRNFIAKNVIMSRRFLYLVRYTKPETVRALMQNRKIVHYVLTRLPESQIVSYLANTSEKDAHDRLDQQIEILTSRITDFSFDSLLSQKDLIVDYATKKSTNKNFEIERLKALTGLYLTVAYVAIKNLVKVNARYYIAFATFDRDLALIESKDKLNLEVYYDMYEYIDKNNLPKKGCNKFLALIRYFLQQSKDVPCCDLDFAELDKIKAMKETKPEEYKAKKKEFWKEVNSKQRHFDKKWRDIFDRNIEECLMVQKTGLLATMMRNDAEHLNVLIDLHLYIRDYRRLGSQQMTSYFELYHYILQRRLLNAQKDEALTIPEAYCNVIERMGIPYSDLTKIAYVSLGYNLPRYKNLTIEALFDPDSQTGKIRTEEHLQKMKKKEEETQKRKHKKLKRKEE